MCSPGTLHRAFRPSHRWSWDLTKTAQNGTMYYSWPQRMILPGYNPTTEAHGRVLDDAARLFQHAFRPVLYVGGGAVRSDAGAEVKALSDLTGAPIVTTLPARGIVPDDDPAVLGMLGMHGTIAATGAVQRSDLLVAIGARFDDRVTGKLEAFAPAHALFTSTSTRPRSARTALPTCRSSAM